MIQDGYISKIIMWSERSQAKTNTLYNSFNINSRKCVLIYSDKKQFTGWLKGWVLKRVVGTLLAVMDMFIIMSCGYSFKI